MKRDDSKDALSLERIYAASQGIIRMTLDDIIREYVILCREYGSEFSIGPFKVCPDYINLRDYSGRYCITFTVEVGGCSIGSMTNYYVDDNSATICTDGVSITVSIPKLSRARRG